MTRALLGVCAVLAALCAIQWRTLDRLQADLRATDARAYRAALVELGDRRAEIERVLAWLDAALGAAPGRSGGLCRVGDLDVATLGAALFDQYLPARVDGVVETDARRRVARAMGLALPEGLQ